MSMLLTDAQAYVSRVIAGQGDANTLLAALDSIRSTFAKWNALRDWTFLLQDNSDTTSIASCVIAGDGVTVTNATAGALFGVNVGQTVTGTGIPANTTVATVTETAGAGVTAFTLSAASTPATVTMTFSAYIPVLAGVQRYNLPLAFHKPYTARLLNNAQPLEYVKLREIDRKFALQTPSAIPAVYTIYNVHAFSVAAQHHHIRLFPIPSGVDNMLLKYYRTMDPASTTLDIPDEFLYVFLDDARVHLLESKAEDDPRLPILMASVQKGIARCIAEDDEESEDEDIRLMSQMEAGASWYVRNRDLGWWWGD